VESTNDSNRPEADFQINGPQASGSEMKEGSTEALPSLNN
jgi:hypothetical protein